MSAQGGMDAGLLASLNKKKDDEDGGAAGGNDGLRTPDPGKFAQNLFKTVTLGLVPVNIGKEAKGFGLESEGIAGKTILPSMLPDAQGGFLARLASILLKHRDIQDMTAGLEKLAWIDVPLGNIGSLSPPSFGGLALESGLSLG